MNCQQVSANLSRYFDGEMNEEESRLCQCHIDDCPDCRAELASFRSLSTLVCSCQDTKCHAPHWDSLAERLDQESQVELATSTRAHSNIYRRWTIGILAASAASLLLLIALPYFGSDAKREIAVDLSKVVSAYAGQPIRAWEELSSKYAGKDVDLVEAKRLLGYQPLSALRLPDNVQLVSSKVLSFPECICANGKCTCGPGGCNCAAMLCQRADGSQFLVLEHCQSSKVNYGKPEQRLTRTGSQPIEVFGTENRLAASWVHRNHQLTAFGLTSQAEIELLASAGKDPS